MIRQILLIILSIFPLCNSASAQTAPDTADFPYWIRMMRSPSPNYYQVKSAYELYRKKHPHDLAKGPDPFQVWEHRIKNKIASDGSIYRKLGSFGEPGFNGQPFAVQPDIETMSTPCPAQGRWTPMGPDKAPWNQSGTAAGTGAIYGMAFHPKDSNTLFALDRAGVWKTTNNGQSWTHLFGGHQVVNSFSVWCMAISYNNADTMYLGTDSGILWTTNGGKTWAPRRSGISGLRVNKIIMDPRNSSILLVSTEGGIYRTVNSGNTWSLSFRDWTEDLVMHPRNRNIVYATVVGQFYRSTDNGQSFSLITAGLPFPNDLLGKIAVTPANRNLVYLAIIDLGGTYIGLYRSIDSGRTFSLRSSSPNITGYDDGTGPDIILGSGNLDIAADPARADVVYVGSTNIWRSNNGGTTWTQVANRFGAFNADEIHPEHNALEFGITGNKIYTCTEGGVFQSSNSGTRWQNTSNGINNTWIEAFSHSKNDEFSSIQAHVGFIGIDNVMHHQTGRDEFYKIYQGRTSAKANRACQMDPANALHAYFAVDGQIFRVTDKNTFRSIAGTGIGGINESPSYMTHILQEGQPETMFVCYDNVWRTRTARTGNPPSWVNITSKITWSGGLSGSSIARLLANSPARNDMLYLITSNGDFYRTGNANAVNGSQVSWRALTKPATMVVWIAAHPKDSNRVYYTDARTLYRSSNKGASWTPISTPSGAGSLNKFIVDPASATELIYIGTDRGVYVWDSLNNSTVGYNNNFPIWSEVSDMDIWTSPQGRGESKLMVSTLRRGMWRTNLYDPGTQKPKSLFYAFDSVLVVGGREKLYEKISGSVSSMTWKISPHTFTYLDGTDSNSYAPVVQFNRRGMYTISLIASNCNGSDTFTRAHWMKVFDKPADPFCRNTTTFGVRKSTYGLYRFSLADNSNETGGYFGEAPNMDFSSTKVFRLRPGTTYTITAKSGPVNGESLRMFLDYNGDGRFQNFRGEVTATTTRIVGTKTLSFTTPTAPALRNRGLRFRLLSDFTALDTNACRNLSNGQGEDYTFVFDMPVPYFTVNKLSACEGESITFTDTSEGFPDRWEWDFGAGSMPRTAQGRGPHQVRYITAGNKSVRLRINGRDSVRKNSYVTISALPDPFVVVKNGDSTTCSGRNVTLALRNRSGSPATYQWQKNGVDLPGKTDSLLVLNNLTLADTGIYSGILINGNCRPVSKGIRLTIYATPKASFTTNNNLQCLRNNRFDFNNTSSIAKDSMTYSWNFGDATTSAQTNPKKVYAAAGTYNAVLIAANRFCRDTANGTVTLHPNPTAAFTLNSNALCRRNTFITTNSSSGASSYNWNFGDGSASNATTPVKNFAAAGTYIIRLIAISADNCRDTLNRSVSVFPETDVRWSVNDSDQCLTDHVFTFTNSSSTSGGTAAYTWKFGDGDSSKAASPVKTYRSPGIYRVSLLSITDKGCRDTAEKTIQVNPQPTTGFTWTLTWPRRVVCTPVITAGLSSFWNFGDGRTSTDDIGVNVYDANGVYTVRLIQTNNLTDCKDTADIPVIIDHTGIQGFNTETDGVYPNPLSPGDGFRFYAVPSMHEAESLTITDMTGREVYNSGNRRRVELRLPADLSPGVYQIKVRNGMSQYSGRLQVR